MLNGQLSENKNLIFSSILLQPSHFAYNTSARRIATERNNYGKRTFFNDF